MNEATINNIDWKYVDSREDGSWYKYALYAFSKDSPEYLLFKELYDQRFPSGSRGIYHTKYVKLIAKAKFLNLF